jgi:manganese/zinc/iron transport system permease protein
LGLRPNAFMAVQDALLVVAVVVALKTVGVVLASALLVAPAVAARQWVGGLAKMLLLAGLFGAGAGVAGAWASIVEPGVPTGPAIVLALAATVGVSLLVAPHRGLLWARARRNA